MQQIKFKYFGIEKSTLRLTADKFSVPVAMSWWVNGAALEMPRYFYFTDGLYLK